jgi:mannose-6-phosphate isomerase-like protein (cupin superfamily)
MDIKVLLETGIFSQYKIVLKTNETAEQEGLKSYQSIYIISGVGIIEYENERYLIKCGDLIFISPHIAFKIFNTEHALLNLFLTQVVAT